MVPRGAAAARGPARRRLGAGSGESVSRVGRHPRRGRRGDPRVPARRRPAEGALALDRPGRRAHGPPRGAALAEPGHAAARHPGRRRTAATARVQLRVGGQRGRQRRRAPRPARLLGPADHRRRRGRRRRRHRRRGRAARPPGRGDGCRTTPGGGGRRPAARHRGPGHAHRGARPARRRAGRAAGLHPLADRRVGGGAGGRERLDRPVAAGPGRGRGRVRRDGGDPDAGRLAGAAGPARRHAAATVAQRGSAGGRRRARPAGRGGVREGGAR